MVRTAAGSSCRSLRAEACTIGLRRATRASKVAIVGVLLRIAALSRKIAVILLDVNALEPLDAVLGMRTCIYGSGAQHLVCVRVGAGRCALDFCCDTPEGPYRPALLVTFIFCTNVLYRMEGLSTVCCTVHDAARAARWRSCTRHSADIKGAAPRRAPA